MVIGDILERHDFRDVSLSGSTAKKTAVTVLSVALLVYALGTGTSLYINRMADPVNQDAEYPGNAFQDFYARMHFSNREALLEQGSVKDIKGSRLEKRLTMAQVGLIDAAKTGEHVFTALQHNDSGMPELRGSVSVACSELSPRVRDACKRDTKYPATFSVLYKGWLNLGKQLGSIDELYRNDTARQKFTNYTVRAEFYDSYLIPGGFQMKPVEAAYYSSDSGLNVIGSGHHKLYVDGEEVEYEKKATWIHSDVKLSAGYHVVRRGNFSLRLPVHGGLPDYTMDDKFRLSAYGDQEFYFNKVVLQGKNWSKEAVLEGKNISIKVPAPPETATFVRDGFNVTVATKDVEDSRPQHGEAFGMTEKEYRHFRKITDWFAPLLKLSGNYGFSPRA
ncbi:MAG: hypothetical protein ABEJ69_01595 [Candidatus Nanohaloarchaea archaeon]